MTLAIERTRPAGDGDGLAEALLGTRDGRSALMRRHNRRLYRLARSIVHDDSEAEDVLQESYVRAFTHLGAFKGEASLGTWLARIVTNEALQRVRRRRPTVDIDSLSETLCGEEDGRTPAEEGPERAAARREVHRLIERAIDTLPVDFRIVFVMRALEQMSVEETAAALAIKPETVKTRFHRANRLLRKALSSDLNTILDDAFPFEGARCDRIVEAVLARLEEG